MTEAIRTVDIIIPIYNGYDDLQLCIPSVKKYTDLKKHRVILINDCSPDERIVPYLDNLAQENILVIHNEKNLGFSGNVNKGMLLSEDRDVILLNSDTIVTKGWVEKITACAYRDDSIGTVTPLSNSATLCSVPIMCQDNPIPEPFSVDEYAELIEKRSLHRYPRITVAVGFCMFIKRCVIRDVGLFDAETFGRGYGEENDFCNRAEQLGYHHVMCDDTFIYHKGTASFDTKEKQALLEAHDAILQERYAGQMKKNHLYCLEKPDQEIRDNINMYTKLQNGKKNLLYFLHLDFQEYAKNNIGGTQIHVQELMEEFRKEYNVFVAARDRDFLCVTAYTEKEKVALKFEIGPAPQFPVFRDKSIRKICEELIRVFGIDLIHVHHTQDLSLEIYHVAHEFGIPVAATLHDYYYACPTILLLDGENHFCASKEALSEPERQKRCQTCLRKKREIAPQTNRYLDIWRREHGKALAVCEKLIFPSESARDIMLRFYPELADRCTVIYHGEDKVEYGHVQTAALGKAEKTSRLKMRLDHVPGEEQGLNAIKGWAYLEGIDNSETELFVEVSSKAGKKFCYKVAKAARPDIVDAYGDPGAFLCGIDLRLGKLDIDDGPIQLRVFVKYKDKLYTDGKTVKATYCRHFGKSDRLNVAFVGGMVPQKGSKMARALIQADQSDINWFVFGSVGDKEFLQIRQENCFFSDEYKKPELPQLFRDNEIDVVCILPIWPETFCYTVSEAWMNGIPVLGTKIGAVGERIEKTNAGWLVSPDASPKEVLDLLHKIKQNPAELAKKKAITRALSMKSVKEMCEEYRVLYAEFSKNYSDMNAAGGDHEFIFQGLALGDPTVNGKAGAALMNRYRNENAALKASIDVMKGTTSYRLARKIAEADIPFKEPLKKILKKKK